MIITIATAGSHPCSFKNGCFSPKPFGPCLVTPQSETPVFVLPPAQLKSSEASSSLPLSCNWELLPASPIVTVS